MAGALQQATEIIKTKQVEAQSKVEVARMQSDTDKLKIEASITIAEINTKAQEVQDRMKYEQDMWMQLHGQAHDIASQQDQQAHDAQQAQQAQAAAAQQQQQAGAQQSMQSAQDHQQGLEAQAAQPEAEQ